MLKLALAGLIVAGSLSAAEAMPVASPVLATPLPVAQAAVVVKKTVVRRRPMMHRRRVVRKKVIIRR